MLNSSFENNNVRIESSTWNNLNSENRKIPIKICIKVRNIKPKINCPRVLANAVNPEKTK